jgi:hypothetical protein
VWLGVIAVDIYDILGKFSSGSLFLLFIALVLAIVDHFYFDEVYRDIISVIGIVALCAFFIVIVVAVVKGAIDKSGDN